MKILVINGPNLNMLGIREPELYGRESYKELTSAIDAHCKIIGVECLCFQSNCEGEIVSKIQSALDKYDGIVINAAAYSHTSIAILDALKAVAIPAVEVHITDPAQREDFRRTDYVALACKKTIAGKGFAGYIEAIDYLVSGK